MVSHEHINSESERITIEDRLLEGKPVKCLVIWDDPPYMGGTGIPAPILLDESTRIWLLDTLSKLETSP